MAAKVAYEKVYLDNAGGKHGDAHAARTANTRIAVMTWVDAFADANEKEDGHGANGVTAQVMLVGENARDLHKLLGAYLRAHAEPSITVTHEALSAGAGK